MDRIGLAGGHGVAEGFWGLDGLCVSKDWQLIEQL